MNSGYINLSWYSIPSLRILLKRKTGDSNLKKINFKGNFPNMKKINFEGNSPNLKKIHFKGNFPKMKIHSKEINFIIYLY